MPNAMHIIRTYRWPKDPKFWVFDEPRFGLVQEPFMQEASAFLSSILGDKCSATLLFSTEHFPTANVILARTWTGENVEKAGCEYFARSPIVYVGSDGVVERSVWLCPAMTYYFGKGTAPAFIYAQVTPEATAPPADAASS
jgi:hypothetical protein